MSTTNWNYRLACALIIVLLVFNTVLCSLLFNSKIPARVANSIDVESITTSSNANELMDDMIDWALEPYSICYIFNQNKDIHNESRIALVTVSDLTSYPHPKSWLPLSRMNRLQYAYNFTYDYCDFPRDPDFTTLRETRWVKFGALYTVLKYYKYVVWLDTDTLFWNRPHIPLNRYALQWFHNHTNLSVLFCDHGRVSPLINAGIFIIKHNTFSFDFLQKSYVNYVNRNMTRNHADQDAFQDFVDKKNENNQVMVIHSSYLQKIYVQANPQEFQDDYKKLYFKQGRTIIFHRVGGGRKKYYQMNDVIKDWLEPQILNKMKQKCNECFGDNSTWRDAVKKVNMNAFENEKGNQILRVTHRH
eukprot:166752_1